MESGDNIKKFKITLLILAFSLILPMINVTAIDGFIGFLSVTLPGGPGKWWHSGVKYSKTEISAQWYYNSGSIDSITGKNIAVQARTWDGKTNSKYIDLAWKKDSTWGTSISLNGGNIARGTYGMDIKRKIPSFSSAKHSGAWYLNESRKV